EGGGPVNDAIGEAFVAPPREPRSRHYHGRLARALEAAASPDAEALAMHWLGAGDSERAVEYAERGAEEAAGKLAFDQAARLLRLRVEMFAAESSETGRLQRRLAEVLGWAGRGAEAAPVSLEAAEGASSLERVDLERAAAEQLLA